MSVICLPRALAPQCYILTTFAALSVGLPFSAQSQSTTRTPSRSLEIAALFSKNKHVMKEKRGVRVEKYKNVTAKPVVASNPAALSGTYRSLDFDFVIRLRVASNGSAEGTGEDPLTVDSHIARPFTIANGKVDGALLTGVKVYRDGKREPIEGVFIDRTTYESPEDRGVKVFGLGVLTKPMQIDGLNIDRLFYERASGQMASRHSGQQ